MPRHSSHFLDLARRGAEVRFRELMDEAKRLVSTFPHLRDSFDPDELPVGFIIAEGAKSGAGVAPPRRGMSAAARRAASERMKRYWAARRKGGARN